MPRTPPTIAAPMPNDPRIFALAKASGLTTREAFACAAECWAWVTVMSVDDIVVNTAPDSLDAVVDVAGFGQAMLEAGLVGTVDGGLVLPAELRRRQSELNSGRAAAAAEDHDDRKERERKGSRIRKRRSRANKALTTPASKVTSVTPESEKPKPNKSARKLGEVDGYPVMQVFSARNDCWFYKIVGASPREFTGTVTDQERPSYADALVSLHAAMKREDQKGLGGNGDNFRPSLKAVVAEAERYRAERAAAAVDDARRDEANRAAAEAAAEDHDDIDHEPAKRDCHAHVTPEQRDTVTVTDASRPEGVTCPPNSPGGGDLGNGECHGHVTVTALSSSSSSSSVSAYSGQSSKATTTTTRGVTPAERDHEDRILDRLVPRRDPVTVEQERKRQELAERFAAALNVSVDSVIHQWRTKRDTLLARLLAAGIDPNTGLRVAAEVPAEPAAARNVASATTEPTTDDKPAAGSVDAPDDDEDLERLREKFAEGLRRATAAYVGVTAS
jgi:hypothetical protein